MIRQKIKNLLNIPNAQIERPEIDGFGDYSTNIALRMAKEERRNPIDAAEEIKVKIQKQGQKLFEKIEIAKPGFINFFLSADCLREELVDILNKGKRFGEIGVGAGDSVQVEFISANPTGPLTLGNGRGGFCGDTLANVLSRAGFKVSREYFVNDAGYQIEVLGHSVLKDDKAQYKGDYIDLLNNKLTGFLKSKEPKKIGAKSARYILEKMIKPTIEKRMKIKFDNWVSEKNLQQTGKIDRLLDLLKQKNLSYEKEGALWFKSSQFGDDKDRVLITSAKEEKSQEGTYFLSDIAYHFDKFANRKFEKVIDIWGADHHGYIGRLQAAKKALELPGELEIIIMQLVRLMENGQEKRMSKRAGVFVTLDELLEEIPLDVARFFFLMHSSNSHLDFDLTLAKEQSQKNPVFYIQYAYARIAGILLKSKTLQGVILNSARDLMQDLKLINHPSELSLIKQLIRLPEIVEDTAKDYQVQRLPQYALELVRAFHKFYEDCRVVDEKNSELTQARLALVEATRIVLKNTLDLMGISAPEKM